MTRAPPSGLDPILSEAPISTARSRIPRTPPPSAPLRGKPVPSSSTSSRGCPPESARLTSRGAPGVARDVRQRLLRDAVEHELGVVAELGQARLDVDVDLELGVLRDPLAEDAQRARQAEVVERLRPQHARDPAHLLEAVARGLLRLEHPLAVRLRHVARGAAELQDDARQRLPDPVMELLGDAQALALLRGERTGDAVAALGLEALEHLVEGRGQLGGVGVPAADVEPVARLERVDLAREGVSCRSGASARRSSSRLIASISARPPAKIDSSRTATSSALGENTSAVIVQAAASTAALPMASRQKSAGPREGASTDLLV